MMNLRNVFLTALVCVEGALSAFAESVASFGERPSWVELADVDVESYAVDTFRHGNQQYILYEYQAQASSASIFGRRAYKILSQTGVEEYSTLVWNLDPDFEELVIHQLEIIRGGERQDLRDTVQFRYSDSLQDDRSFAYDNSVDARLILPDVRVGDTIVYSYTITGANPVELGYFSDSLSLNWGVPVHVVHVRYVDDGETPLRWKAHNGAPDPVESADAAGHRVWTWSLEDPELVEWESNSPGHFYPQMWVELSNWEDWERVSRWGNELYDLSVEFPEAMREALAGIKTLPYPRDQILEAIRFVQDEVRYLSMVFGPHGYKPFEPHTIARNRYGDCKDKTYLLLLFFRELGVKGWPVLVDVDDVWTIAERLPSPAAFDHVVTQYEFGGETLMVDPTYRLQGGDIKTAAFRKYGYGLPLTADGSSLAEEIGPQSLELGRIEVTEQFEMPDWYGAIELAVITEQKGYKADTMRSTLADYSLSDLSKDYLQFYQSMFPNAVEKVPLAVEDNRLRNQITLTEQYELTAVFEPRDGEDDGYLYRYFEGTTVYNEMPDISNAEQRTQPFRLNRSRVSHTLELSYSGKASFLPERETVNNPYFDFTYTVSPMSGLLRVVFTYETEGHDVPAEDVAQLQEDLERARDLSGYDVMVPVEGTAAAGSDRESLVGLLGSIELNLASFVAAFFGFLGGTGVVFFVWRSKPKAMKPLYDPDKAKIRGWLFLPCLFLCVSFLSFTVLPLMSASMIASKENWRLYGDPASPQYIEHFMSVSLALTAYYSAMLPVFAFATVSFFRKQWFVPRLIIGTYLAQLVQTALMTGYVSMNEISPFLAQEVLFDSYSLQSLLSTCLGSMIWILYFNSSRRVAANFRRVGSQVFDEAGEELVPVG